VKSYSTFQALLASVARRHAAHRKKGEETAKFPRRSYNTFNHRNFSLGLPTNNGALDQNTNGNPQDLAYALVTNAQFLKNKAFNGGSRSYFQEHQIDRTLRRGIPRGNAPGFPGSQGHSEPASTSTTAETEPTSKRTLASAIWLDSTVTPFCTDFLKPSFSTETVYVPIDKFGKT
jgi:hypothetical protein